MSRVARIRLTRPPTDAQIQNQVTDAKNWEEDNADATDEEKIKEIAESVCSALFPRKKLGAVALDGHAYAHGRDARPHGGTQARRKQLLRCTRNREDFYSWGRCAKTAYPRGTTRLSNLLGPFAACGRPSTQKENEMAQTLRLSLNPQTNLGGR